MSIIAFFGGAAVTGSFFLYRGLRRSREKSRFLRQTLEELENCHSTDEGIEALKTGVIGYEFGKKHGDKLVLQAYLKRFGTIEKEKLDAYLPKE